MSTKKTTCEAHQLGSCPDPKKCKKLHPSSLCVDWAFGKCTRGTQCSYLHRQTTLEEDNRKITTFPNKKTENLTLDWDNMYVLEDKEFMLVSLDNV